jgi:hypothetical protein
MCVSGSGMPFSIRWLRPCGRPTPANQNPAPWADVVPRPTHFTYPRARRRCQLFMINTPAAPSRRPACSLPPSFTFFNSPLLLSPFRPRVAFRISANGIIAAHHLCSGILGPVESHASEGKNERAFPPCRIFGPTRF